jgi:hypothetical protein
MNVKIVQERHMRLRERRFSFTSRLSQRILRFCFPPLLDDFDRSESSYSFPKILLLLRVGPRMSRSGVTIDHNWERSAEKTIWNEIRSLVALFSMCLGISSLNHSFIRLTVDRCLCDRRMCEIRFRVIDEYGWHMNCDR